MRMSLCICEQRAAVGVGLWSVVSGMGYRYSKSDTLIILASYTIAVDLKLNILCFKFRLL